MKSILLPCLPCYLPRCLTLGLSALVLTCAPAAADDDLRGETFCYPAKKVERIISDLAEIDTERRNVVDVKLDPKFLINDGGTWADRFYLRVDDTITELTVEKPSGRVPDFLNAVNAAPDSDVCIDDKARADRPKFDEGLYFEMGLSPYFHNRSGTHDLKELREGTKDGRKFYKKMAPGPLGMFVPDCDYLAIKYEAADITPVVFAMVDGIKRPVASTAHDTMHVVSLKALEKAGAAALIIEGGAYNLQPVPSVKFMKRIGWGDAG